MIIIWGQQNNEKKLGYVAEYCTNCRQVRAVKILRVSRVWHVYYIPLGAGTVLGYDGVCRKCELRFGVSITGYPAFESDKNAELLPLAQKTNPRLLVGNEAVVAVWRRMSEIRAPFIKYDQMLIQHSLGGSGFDTGAVLAFLASFAVPITLVNLVSLFSLPPSAGPWVTLIAIALLVGGLIWTYDLSRKRPLRYFRSSLEAQLEKDVRLLAPTRAELEECIAGLRDYGYRIANLVSVDRFPDYGDPTLPPPETMRSLLGVSVTASAPAFAAAPPPVQIPTLVLSHGGKEYRFAQGVADIVIGRSPENAIVLKSKSVSRSHVQLAWPAGPGSVPVLKNLSSAGTALRLDGTAQTVQCKGDVLLQASGTIALGADFAAAEADGDVIQFRLTAA